MQVRQLILTASAFVIAGAGPALGQGLAAPIAGDSGLQSLVAEALERNPTLVQRQAAVRAATLRIRPAGSLPDPMLSVGVMDLLLPPRLHGDGAGDAAAPAGASRRRRPAQHDALRDRRRAAKRSPPGKAGPRSPAVRGVRFGERARRGARRGERLAKSDAGRLSRCRSDEPHSSTGGDLAALALGLPRPPGTRRPPSPRGP